MKETIYTIDEISDTRELIEARTPRFVSIFIWSLLGMIAVGFLWSWFGEIDETVKVTGVVRPLVPVSVIRNIVSGNATESAVREDLTVKKGDVLYRIDSGPVLSEIENVRTQIDRLTDKKKNLLLFEQSVLARKNRFPRTNIEYHNKYLVYEYELEKLNLTYVKAKSIYEIQKGLSDTIARVKLDELASEMKLAELNRNKFVSENIVAIKSELSAAEDEAFRLSERLAKLEESLAYCTVSSPIDGKIQLVHSFNAGDYIPAAIEIARIIPEDSAFLKIELLVPNREIGRIELGKKIQYDFLSLPASEYGHLFGTVVKLPADTTTHEAAREPVYIAEGDLPEAFLKSPRGGSVQVKIGMMCEARIILEKKRVLLSLLQKLNFVQ